MDGWGALTSPLGIVNHVTHVKWRCIDGGMLGQPTHRTDREFILRDALVTPAPVAGAQPTHRTGREFTLAPTSRWPRPWRHTGTESRP